LCWLGGRLRGAGCRDVDAELGRLRTHTRIGSPCGDEAFRAKAAELMGATRQR